MDDIYRKGIGTDLAKKIAVFVHHEIGYFTFFEPFSYKTSEKEKEKPGKKRKIIRGTETAARKSENSKEF